MIFSESDAGTSKLAQPDVMRMVLRVVSITT